MPELGELDPLEVVTGGRGFASNHYLRENFHRCIDLYSKMWHHHTELLMLGYGAYVVFFEFCKQAFPEMGDQMVARMVAGMDVTMYRPDDELKKLAGLAVELDLADLFVEGTEPAKVLSSLGERGDAGARWLAALEAAKDPWFNVSVGDGFYHHHLSWADDLTVPFAALPRYVEQIAAGEDLTRPTERLAEERDRIATEYRALLDSEDEQGRLRPDARPLPAGLPLHRVAQVLLRALVHHPVLPEDPRVRGAAGRAGRAADADDVFHLRHVEVEDALADVMLAWASGGTELGARHWQPIVAERKRIVEALSGWSPPPALGAVPEALNDPAVKMLWGITQETIETWLGGEEDDELDGPRLRGLARRGRGHRPGAAQRQRHRPDPRGRGPRLPRDRAQLGPGLRQDRRGRLRHRRHHVARGDRGPRVRHAGRRRYRSWPPTGSGPATASGSTATAASSPC